MCLLLHFDLMASFFFDILMRITEVMSTVAERVKVISGYTSS